MDVTSASRHLTASMVVLRGDEVLLVHHRASGTMMFPGGHVDDGEAPHEAAVREVAEETGLSVDIVGHRLTATPLPAQFTALPPAWMTVEMTAPAKPARPGRAAEPAHRHIDFLYIGVPAADAGSDLVAALGEVAGAEWVWIGGLIAYRGRYRAEVPEVAYAAWHHLHRPTTPAGTAHQSVSIGTLSADTVTFGDRR